MHENPSAPITLQRDLMKLESWKTFFLWGGFLLHDFSLAWFVFVIVTLEIILPNHTWNIIISSKPYFVIIKIKIDQTLVSHFLIEIRCLTNSKNVFKKIIFLCLIYYEKYEKKNQLKTYVFSNYLIIPKKKVNYFEFFFF